jgi:6-phosphogluconolactonase
MTLIDEISAILEASLSKTGEVSIALSGGSSPVALYEGLSSLELGWERVRVTLIDDRLVPADHVDSNQKLVRNTLLRGKAGVAEFTRLQDWQVNHFPDIAILGMGMDGHFASLFPAMMDDAKAFDLAAKPEIITTAPMGNPLHARITMNLSMILAIPHRVLMVVSEEKKAVLSAARNGADLPITRLLAHDGTQISYERI